VNTGVGGTVTGGTGLSTTRLKRSLAAKEVAWVGTELPCSRGQATKNRKFSASKEHQPPEETQRRKFSASKELALNSSQLQNTQSDLTGAQMSGELQEALAGR